jgi:hypothetical protein
LAGRHRRAAALGAALVVLAPSAYALFEPTAALRLAVLIRIAAIAREIHATAGAIATATRAIQERQEAMFPSAVRRAAHRNSTTCVGWPVCSTRLLIHLRALP